MHDAEHPIEIRACAVCQRLLIRAAMLAVTYLDLLPPSTAAPPLVIPPGYTLQQLTQQAIAQTLARTGGNASEAARLLGISRRGLLNWRQHAMTDKPTAPTPKIARPLGRPPKKG